MNAKQARIQSEYNYFGITLEDIQARERQVAHGFIECVQAVERAVENGRCSTAVTFEIYKRGIYQLVKRDLEDLGYAIEIDSDETTAQLSIYW